MTKIRFNAPTSEMPFFHNVSMMTKQGWKKVVENSPERGRSPALFPTKEEMISRLKKEFGE